MLTLNISPPRVHPSTWAQWTYLYKHICLSGVCKNDHDERICEFYISFMVHPVMYVSNQVRSAQLGRFAQFDILIILFFLWTLLHARIFQKWFSHFPWSYVANVDIKNRCLCIYWSYLKLLVSIVVGWKWCLANQTFHPGASLGLGRRAGDLGGWLLLKKYQGSIRF